MKAAILVTLLGLGGEASAEEAWWLRVRADGKTLLFRPDGTGRTEVPAAAGQAKPSADAAAIVTVKDDAIHIADAEKIVTPKSFPPVPGDAGLSRTRPAPNLPINWCGKVFSINGTRIRLFFAASTAFLIASGTSRALPVPNPTWPDSSPTTTSAANDRFFPPFTTLVTRLIEMT